MIYQQNYVGRGRKAADPETLAYPQGSKLLEKQVFTQSGFDRAFVFIKSEGAKGPISSITINRDIANVAANNLLIEFPRSGNARREFSNAEYIRLRELGAEPLTMRANKPISHLEVADYRKTIDVIDWLYRHKYTSESENQKLEACICDLFSWAEYSEAKPQDIASLKDFLGPYVDEFKKESTASKSALEYFNYMIDTLNTFDFQKNPEDIFNEQIDAICDTFSQDYPKVSRQFVQSLYTLSSLFSSPRLLSSVFNTDLPLTERTVQKVIWDYVNEDYKKEVVIAQVEPDEYFPLSIANATLKVKKQYKGSGIGKL